MTEKKPASKRKTTTATVSSEVKKPAARKGIKAAPTRKASTKRASTAAVAYSASDAEIARKAYELWEERGRPFGSPEEDWKNAVAQLRPN